MTQEAMVSMPLTQFQEMVKAQANHEARVVDLTHKLRLAEVNGSSDAVPGLLAAIKYATEVIQFAVGNLPPESVRGWPTDALERFGIHLEKLPGGDEHVKALGHDLQLRAAEIEQFDRTRVPTASLLARFANQPTSPAPARHGPTPESEAAMDAALEGHAREQANMGARCPVCNGTGGIPLREALNGLAAPCNVCNGTGKL